ncbi:TraB/GumN family protein [Paenibacillus tarimensis]
MKKIAVSFLTFLMALSVLMPTVFAAEKQLSVQVDGQQVEFGAYEPVIDGGTTLVPLRPLFDSLGLTLDWDAEEQAATGTKQGLVVELQTGNSTAAVNGMPVELPKAPKAIGGTTYVPVRFVGEAAGYEVSWDPATRSVILETVERARGFLWEAEHNGNKVYLLGSMHIADNSFYPLHPSMEEAFASADVLAVEVDLSKGADPEVQELVMSMGTYQDGTTLKDHISKETYDKLGEVLAANGLPADSFDTFKPWVIQSTLMMMQAMESGYGSQVGIDLYFTMQAAEREMPVVELESYESQLNMFNSFSAELQEELLVESLNNFDRIGGDVDAMADMWKQGDEAALLEMTKTIEANEEYYKAMLVDRNIAMADKIDGYLQGEEPKVYLVVVGAAHMPGEDGIVKLLQEKGYTVNRK